MAASPQRCSAAAASPRLARILSVAKKQVAKYFRHNLNDASHILFLGSDRFKPFSDRFGPFSNRLGPFRTVVGPFRPVFGPLSKFQPFRTVFKQFRILFGPFLDCFGPFSDCFARIERVRRPRRKTKKIRAKNLRAKGPQIFCESVCDDRARTNERKIGRTKKDWIFVSQL